MARDCYRARARQPTFGYGTDGFPIRFSLLVNDGRVFIPYGRATYIVIITLSNHVRTPVIFGAARYGADKSSGVICITAMGFPQHGPPALGLSAGSLYNREMGGGVNR